MTYMIVFKSGLAGLSDGVVSEKEQRVHRSLEAVLFLAYSMRCPAIWRLYSWNIMWLDCIVLLPLILHGLERLVREKKGLFTA